MALRQAVFLQKLPHGVRQPQQPQLVGHRRLGAAQTTGGLLLAEPVAGNEPGQGLRLLPAVQIPALEVLHQRQQRRVLLPYLRHQTRHLPQSRHGGGPQAALSGHQLIACPLTAHRQGLEDAVAADAFRQLRQGILVEAAAGLLGIGADLVQGNIADTAGKKFAFAGMHHGGSLLLPSILAGEG